MKYLVDADWLIDAAIGRPVAVRTLDRLSGDGLAVSLVAVAEVYEGAFRTPHPEATLAEFREFLAAYAHLPLTDPISERFAGCGLHCAGKVNSFPTWTYSSRP